MSRFISTPLNYLLGAESPQRFSVQLIPKKTLEPTERHEPGGYHRVQIGEVYNDKYQVIRQLGWGRYSTVWLVQDAEGTFGAMKILVGNFEREKGSWDEIGVLKTLREANTLSPGYRHICHLVDDFVHEGPNGSHTCLILEPMGPSVIDLYRGFAGPMPLPLVRRISKHVLRALQYLHGCHLIHTDIKGDNILMSGPLIGIGHEDVHFDYEDLMSCSFKLADFGAANKMSNRFAQRIQPAALRSPEVIIGAPWDTKTDIWNLGCLIYEFARGAQLFDPFWNDESGMNPPQRHLAQIDGLLGTFPSGFLAKGTKTHRYFDDQGWLLRGEGIYLTTLDALLQRANHPVDDIPIMVDFLLRMLTIDPEERWSASQLLGHPWLGGVEERH